MAHGDGVEVMTRGEVLEAALAGSEWLGDSGIPAALAGDDPALWRGSAVPRGHSRWLDLQAGAGALLPALGQLVEQARRAGLDEIVVVGATSTTRAAAAIAADTGARPILIDGIDPVGLRAALARLDRLLVVLADKSGTAIEIDCHRRIFEWALRDSGVPPAEVGRRFVAVTDAGSPLEAAARRSGYRLVLTDPGLPAHYGALSAYGLVPAVLAGGDVTALIDQAHAALPGLMGESDNPGLLLGAVLGGWARAPGGVAKDKLLLHAPGTRSPFGTWLVHLLTSATGKDGRGVLPVDENGWPLRGPCPDVHTLVVDPVGSPPDASTVVWGPLGAQLVTWEYAATVAALLIGVDPFDISPDTPRAAETETFGLLQGAGHGPLRTGEPLFVDGAVEVHADATPGKYGTEVAEVVAELLRVVPVDGYLGVLSYLGRDEDVGGLEAALAGRLFRPVVFSTDGYLHRTGTYHLDGPRTGVFLVITGDLADDTAVPGTPYTLGKVRLARALADVRALRRRRLPVVRLHLRDLAEGTEQLMKAVRA